MNVGFRDEGMFQPESVFQHNATRKSLQRIEWPGCGATLEMAGPGLLQVVAMTSSEPWGKPMKDAGQAMSVDQIWLDFMSNPSEWWDNRFEKRSPRSPDFRHKQTKEVLWVESWSNPPWVKARLAAMTQDLAQSDDGTNFNIGGRGGSSLKTAAPERVKRSSFSTPGDVKRLCKEGQLKEALQLLNQPDTWVDSDTYVCLLRWCINKKALAEGKQVHTHINQSGFKPKMFLFNTLINMYTKCRSVVDARQVFDEMPERNMFTWTMMMAGYAKHQHAEEAFKLYEQMIQGGVTIDRVGFICVLSACTSLGALEKGKQVHADIIKAGITSYVNLGNALVDMYSKCGSLKDARGVFDNMPKRDWVSWNAMIAGYAQHGSGGEALKVYEQMQREGVMPDGVTFIGVLNGCASLGALEKGKQIHADIVKAGIASYINLENALLDMYVKCGSVEDACELLKKMPKRDVVSWTTLIAGYVQLECGWNALNIYEQMQQEGVVPDRITFICVLTACASLRVLEKGKQIHADIIKYEIQPCIKLETALIDMYAKCGSIEDAHQVFNNMPRRDVVSWTALIAGYAQQGCGMEALEIYEQMQQERVIPNSATFIGILSGCAYLGALEKGKQVHADILKLGIPSDINLDTALVDMYAKCGSLKDARRVFDMMARQDVVSWSAMISGYAQHGFGGETLHLFQQMQQEAVKPHSITFTSILSACGHVGLVDEGRHFFACMSRDHGLTPTVEHFGCMVDLLGRAGQFDEAEDFIKKMPIQPDTAIWGALLGACRIHGKLELAEHAANCILQLDPQDPAAYVQLSNIYAAAGRWDDKVRVRKMMEDRGVTKEPGCSCIEVNNHVHAFVAEDKLHPQIDEIHTELKRLSGRMKEAGYVPDTHFVVHNTEEEQKEFSLCHHSERLAIALVSSAHPPGTPIRVIKNLRVCGDCHTATKLISLVVGREVIVRDARRFHHFRNGSCSCGDYW